VSERNRIRGAELRAERVRWRERSRNVSQASQSMNERLRRMRDQGSNLDKRLRQHANDSERWHTVWDDPAMTGD
jgi:predicted nuclease with TOPRIM domain